MVGITSTAFLGLGVTAEIVIGFLLGLRLWMLRYQQSYSLGEVTGVAAFTTACLLSMYGLAYYLWCANQYIGWENTVGMGMAMQQHMEASERTWQMKVTMTSLIIMAL